MNVCVFKKRMVHGMSQVDIRDEEKVDFVHRGELVKAAAVFFRRTSSPISLTEVSLRDPGLAPGELPIFFGTAK